VQVIYWFITLWDLAEELKPYGVQIESKCCPVLCSVQICAKIIQGCALRIWKEFILPSALKTNSIVYKLFHWSVSFNVLLFPRWSRNASFVKPKVRYWCSVKVITAHVRVSDTVSSKIHFKIIILFTRMAHRRCQRRIPNKFKTVSCFGCLPKVKQALLSSTVRFLSVPCFQVSGLPVLSHNFVFRGAGLA